MYVLLKTIQQFPSLQQRHSIVSLRMRNALSQQIHKRETQTKRPYRYSKQATNIKEIIWHGIFLLKRFTIETLWYFVYACHFHFHTKIFWAMRCSKEMYMRVYLYEFWLKEY